MFDFNPGPLQQLDAVVKPVGVLIDNASDAGLNYEFRALHARGCCDIESRALAAVAGLCNLRDCICLCMKDIRFGDTVLVFADILESRRGAVVAVR